MSLLWLPRLLFCSPSLQGSIWLVSALSINSPPSLASGWLVELLRSWVVKFLGSSFSSLPWIVCGWWFLCCSDSCPVLLRSADSEFPYLHRWFWGCFNGGFRFYCSVICFFFVCTVFISSVLFVVTVCSWSEMVWYFQVILVWFHKPIWVGSINPLGFGCLTCCAHPMIWVSTRRLLERAFYACCCFAQGLLVRESCSVLAEDSFVKF
jgi:hypothetical protein